MLISMCIVTIQHWFTYSKQKEPLTLRLKKLIENLNEYKFDIYFLKGKEMHISDFLSRHPDGEDSPNEINTNCLYVARIGDGQVS